MAILDQGALFATSKNLHSHHLLLVHGVLIILRFFARHLGIFFDADAEDVSIINSVPRGNADVVSRHIFEAKAMGKAFAS